MQKAEVCLPGSSFPIPTALNFPDAYRAIERGQVDRNVTFCALTRLPGELHSLHFGHF